MAQGKSHFLTWFILGSIAVGAFAFYNTGTSTAPSLKAKTQRVSSNQGTATPYTSDDYSAHFARLDSSTPDIFNPLVDAQLGGASSNEFDLPTEMTSGELNWSFNGTVGLNGSHMALFENSRTGKGSYVKVGQHWKSCMVESINGDSVVLRSDAGSTKTVMMAADLQQLAAQTKLNSLPPGLVPPVNPGAPPMVGQIGGNEGESGTFGQFGQGGRSGEQGSSGQSNGNRSGRSRRGERANGGTSIGSSSTMTIVSAGSDGSTVTVSPKVIVTGKDNGN